MQRQPYGPWMFGLGPELVSPDRIGWWWSRSRKLSGIDAKWRLHDLRHWSATVAIGQGHDVRTNTRTRDHEPSLLFEHRTARHERVLWLADAVSWAVGAGHPWIDAPGNALIDVIDVDPT